MVNAGEGRDIIIQNCEVGWVGGVIGAYNTGDAVTGYGGVFSVWPAIWVVVQRTSKSGTTMSITCITLARAWRFSTNRGKRGS